MIYVDPAKDLVIAMHSAWPEATGGGEFGAHRAAFLQALAEAL